MLDVDFHLRQVPLRLFQLFGGDGLLRGESAQLPVEPVDGFHRGKGELQQVAVVSLPQLQPGQSGGELSLTLGNRRFQRPQPRLQIGLRLGSLEQPLQRIGFLGREGR